MKSKKVLAQIAAFSLVFGMTGVVSSWADDIVLGGKPGTNNETGLVKNEDGSFTVKDKDVKGVWLQNGSKLTANRVNFINGGKGSSEISVDTGSTLIVNGGSIKSDQDAFNVNDGSKAEVNNAKVTTGAWANNAAITLKNSNTSGNWLYAGNAFPDPEKENDNGPVKEGLPVGSITIDGGRATVKNVLVQNKGQFNVTNGAVLDVTKDTSATDTEWSQPATGITKGGEIVVRAWGPNTAQAEKGNSDSDPVNELDQVSTLAVNGATVRANKLTVEGKVANDISYTEKAAFTAKNSTVEVKQATFNEYARGEIDNTKLNVNGDLTIKGNGTYDGNGWTFADTDGNVTVNDSAVNVTGKVAIDGAKLYIAGHHSTTGSDEESLAAESEDKPSLTASDITLTNEAMLTTDNQAVVNADIVTMNSGTVLSVNGHSTLNAKHLKVSDTAKRVRVRGNFDGQVMDVNGNALSKERVKKFFLLNPNDKTSLEFQDPEVDHTLVLHMNADGGLTMQGKDFSQSDTGNTRTYIMASWSANGDYNAEGHDIKNVNSLSANRLVINGTDITDSLGGAVDVYTKTDTDKKIEDSLTDVNKAVAGKADKADVEKLGQKVDQKVSELNVNKADANASNIDVAAYTNKLNTGKVEDGNKGLVSGGVVWNAIKDVKNNTGAGWVKVNGDTVAIASDAGATKVSVAGLKGDRVLTGVKTDEKDASSAANVGYVNSTAISLTDSMNAMNSKLSDDIKNAGAVGAALAGLHHLDYDPDNKLDVAVAAGNYRGKSATAMGLFYQPNEMMMVSAGATIGADDNAYNVGLSFKVGKGQTGLTTSKAAMSQEIKELKAAKKESDQKMAAQDEEIRALKEQVAMLVKEMKLSNTVEKDMKK